MPFDTMMVYRIIQLQLIVILHTAHATRLVIYNQVVHVRELGEEIEIRLVQSFKLKLRVRNIDVGNEGKDSTKLLEG